VQSSELQQGQKLLGWGLILVGLALLMLVGLAQALVDRYSLPWLQGFVSWAPGAWWNRTCVGIVAWLLLAAGYVFLVSAHLEEHLRRMEGQMAERLDRLTREIAVLKRGSSERSPASHLAPTPSSEASAGYSVAAP
jgi:thiosulfate reductase cytochrome b subunit